MKKLIALIAIVVLCGTFVYAAGLPIIENGNTTKATNAGVFQATVIVPLTISQPIQGQVNLGTFVNGATYVNGTDFTALPFTWTITGQMGANYTVTFNTDFGTPTSVATLNTTWIWNSGNPGWTPTGQYPEQFGTNGTTTSIADPNTGTDVVTCTLNSITAQKPGTESFSESVTVAYVGM